MSGRRWFSLAIAFGLAISVLVRAQVPAFNAMVTLDSSGYLNVSASGAGSGQSPPSPLGNTLVKTDSNNYLLVNCQVGCAGAGSLPSAVQGDLPYASGVNTYTVLNKNTTATRYLSNTGTSNNPAWAQVVLANGISGFGTGIATALAVNTGSAGAPVLFNGALGTPSSGTGTNITGLPEGSLTLSNVTTNDATTIAHGFLIKGDANVAHCLSGNITWVACGGSASASFYQTLDSQTNVAADSPVSVASSKGIYYCNAVAGPITYALPAVASSTNYIFTFVKTDTSANACIMDGNSAETVNGAATLSITGQFSNATIHTTGSTGWTSVMAAGPQLADPNVANAALIWNNSTKTLVFTGGLSIASGKSLTVSNTLTLTGTDSTSFAFPSGSGTVATADSTATFTNKTIDASSGATNTIKFTSTVPINIAVCQGTTASFAFSNQATGNATANCYGSTIIGSTIDFANATTNEVQFQIGIPADWDGGNMTLGGQWRTTTTTNSVIWQVSGKCGADAAVVPTTYNTTPDTVTDAAKGTTLQANDFSVTLSTTSNHVLSGCSAGNTLYLRFFRDNSDSLGATASLLRLNLTWNLTK